MTSHELTSTGSDDQIDLVGLWRAAWDYRFLILGCVFLGAALSAWLAFTAIPKFRAEVIITEAQDSDMGGAGSIASRLGGLASLAGVSIGSGGGAREGMAVLESRRLVEEFIERNDLLPLLFPHSEKPPTLWLGVREFRSRVITIRQEEAKGLTSVTMEWTDPATASRWANAFVALANELVRTHALDEANRNISYLTEQISRTNLVEMQKVMYNLIESETKTLMLANGRIEYAFRIIDPAVPPEVRSSPRRTIMVALGIVLGGFLGVLAAFVHSAWARHHRRLATVA